MLKYDAGVLENVFLENGYEELTTRYGPGVRYTDLEGLDVALRSAVLVKPSRLNGDEILFLRQLLDSTQTQLAERFGLDEQTVSLWERNTHALPAHWDAILRRHVLDTVGPQFYADVRRSGIAPLFGLASREERLRYIGRHGGDSGWVFRYEAVEDVAYTSPYQRLAIPQGVLAAWQTLTDATYIDKTDAIRIIGLAKHRWQPSSVSVENKEVQRNLVYRGGAAIDDAEGESEFRGISAGASGSMVTLLFEDEQTFLRCH